jgi:hypothetical protein
LGLFVGYASNSHTYCILNKSTGCIEETVNVECDENNGFHAEQFVSSVVGDEAPSQATSTMGIGHILPQETPHVHVEEGVRAPLVDPPQGKSSPPTQEQDAMGDHLPIQEQDQVPHVRGLDQGPLEPMLSLSVTSTYFMRLFKLESTLCMLHHGMFSTC